MRRRIARISLRVSLGKDDPTLDLNYTLDRVLNLDCALDRHLAETSNYDLLRTHNLAHHQVRVRGALIRDLDRVHKAST
ncbi:MAG TPA: hypothetical protein VHY21_10150 [Pseudonocardiaceae bacterium]|nr:hypothetical protein [Pseudonocardiaceae bacterium]